MSKGIKNIYSKVVSWAKDFTSITVALGIVFTSLWMFFNPVLQPYLVLPEVVNEILKNQEEISRTLRDSEAEEEFRVVEYQSMGFVLEDRVYEPGEIVVINYFLRRNASCDTLVSLDFINLDNGLIYNAGIVPDQKAPITNEFIFFKFALTIPLDIPEGTYSYWPSMQALDCGVYSVEPIRVVPTQPIVVRNF